MVETFEVYLIRAKSVDIFGLPAAFHLFIQTRGIHPMHPWLPSLKLQIYLPPVGEWGT